MIKQISDTQIFINEPTDFKIKSGIFMNKNVDGVIFIYDSEYNDFDVELTDNKSTLLNKLEDVFCSDCDGYIAWVPKTLQPQFIQFVQEFIIEQNNDEELNFSNGSVGEAFGLHYFDEGVLVEMLDPECFTEVFKKCIKKFCEQEGVECTENDNLNLNEMFAYYSPHLVSKFRNVSNQDSSNKRFFELFKLKQLS